MQGFHDHAAIENVFDRHAFSIQGLRIVRSVLAVDDLHGGDLLGRRAVVVHVPHEHQAKALRGAMPPVRRLVEHIARDGRGCARARAAEAHPAVSIHRAKDDHGIAHAGLEDAHGDADQRFRAGPAAQYVHEEIQSNAEIARNESGRRRVEHGIGQHAVHVRRREPCILDCVFDGPRPQGPRRPARAAAIGRLAYTNDGVLAAQSGCARSVDIGCSSHGQPLYPLPFSTSSAEPAAKECAFSTIGLYHLRV